MKSIQAAFAALCLCLLFGPLVLLRGAEFVLVDQPAGIAPPNIVLANDASPRTREAAATLAQYIGAISGQKPQVLDQTPRPFPGRAIWVGFQPVLRQLLSEADFAFKHPEETLIAATENHLVICGRDRMVGDVQVEHGTANAVFTFLEKDLQVRWLWPGELGTDIPRQSRIALAPIQRRFHPIFRYRVLWPRRPEPWQRAQRLLDHSLRFEANHAFNDWWDKYHQQHPDYFALLANGQRQPAREPRNVKLCVSNPAVAAQWLDNAQKAFSEDPSRIMMSASPTDGDGFCVCPNCRAMDHPDGPPIFGYVALTDRYVKFWNILARGLHQRFPQREAWVGAYAYSAYRSPPIAEKLEDNIAIGYVGHFPMAGEETRRQEKEQWLAWSKQARAMVYRPNLFHYSGGFLGLPTLSLRKTIEDLRFLAEHHCIGFEVDTLPMCWATQGVQYYLMAQLAYDPLQDGQALLQDYCQRGFGPAATAIARYFAVLEEAHDAVLERIKHSSGWARQATAVYQDIYVEDLWSRAATHLAAAEAAVATAAEPYRLRVDFLRTGFEAARLQVEILRAMKAVRDSSGKDATAIARADDLCARRDKLFERYKGLAMKRSNWYVETRKLADYIDPPSPAMRSGSYRGPGAAPDMKARD